MSFPFNDLGACYVYWDGTSLGEVGSVTVNYEEVTADHKTAAYGSSAKDRYYVGTPCSVEVAMKESTLAQLANTFNNATVTGNELMVGSPIGNSMRDSAAKLEIRPVESGVASSTATKYITFFVAAPRINMSLPFDESSDREVMVTFDVFRTTEVASGETYEVGDIWAFGYGETS